MNQAGTGKDKNNVTIPDSNSSRDSGVEPDPGEESGLAKSNFLARMSHEMRTPLNAIIGMSTIAQNTEDLKKISQCLHKINEASLYLLGMITSILDMAKIEAGNLKLTNAEFNLPHMLKRIIKTVSFSLDAKRQELKLDFDPNLPETIISDEQRLTQVLDNLLSNALKFTAPEGIITLSVKKLWEDEETCTLEIKIIDTGIGISSEELKKTFKLFEQADGGIARKYQGAGLGLAICAGIVHLMGGDIWVESKPGKGSAFGIKITVARRSKKAEKGISASEKDSTGAVINDQKPKFTGFSILLAEDVEINREIVLTLLENTGITIDCAQNGLQAVEMFKASPSKYAAILMDIHMPQMDGYEATRQIRAFEELRSSRAPEIIPQTPGGQLPGQASQVPIIAMTANVFKDDVEKCLEVGMTTHLGKPIDFEELVKKLEKYLLKR